MKRGEEVVDTVCGSDCDRRCCILQMVNAAVTFAAVLISEPEVLAVLELHQQRVLLSTIVSCAKRRPAGCDGLATAESTRSCSSDGRNCTKHCAQLRQSTLTNMNALFCASVNQLSPGTHTRIQQLSSTGNQLSTHRHGRYSAASLSYEVEQSFRCVSRNPHHTVFFRPTQPCCTASRLDDVLSFFA